MNDSVVCIIPAFNAEETVATVAKAIRREVPGIVVIGVDDGSTDGTRAQLRRACDATIEFDTNQGKGAALRAAFADARTRDVRAVLTIDADGQHDPSFAPRLLDRLQVADIVIGTRQLNTGTVPIHRRLANFVSSAVTRLLTKSAIADSQSGYRAINAKVLHAIDAHGSRYEFETDFLVRAARAGFTVTEVAVPTIYGPPSHFRPLSDAWRVARILWSHRAAVFR